MKQWNNNGDMYLYGSKIFCLKINKVYQIQHHRVIQKELPPIIVSQDFMSPDIFLPTTVYWQFHHDYNINTFFHTVHLCINIIRHRSILQVQLFFFLILSRYIKKLIFVWNQKIYQDGISLKNQSKTTSTYFKMSQSK